MCSADSEWVDVFQTAGEDEVLDYLDADPTPPPDNDRHPIAIAILRDQIRVADRLLAAGNELGPTRGWFRSIGMAGLLERSCGPCPAEALSQALVSALERGHGPLQDWLPCTSRSPTAGASPSTCYGRCHRPSNTRCSRPRPWATRARRRAAHPRRRPSRQRGPPRRRCCRPSGADQGLDRRR